MGEEDIVRAYLTYVDTGQVPVSEELEKLRLQLEEAADPIEKLKLHGLVAQAAPTPELLTERFVGIARPWATSQDPPIGRSSFASFGVPKGVLDQAFPTATAKGSTRGPRAPGVRQERVESVVRGLTEPFTMADIVGATGATAITARIAVARLVADGEVTVMGQRSNPRGRSSTLYQVTSSVPSVSKERKSRSRAAAEE